MSNRFLISQFTVDENKVGIIVYDLHKEEVVDCLTDYLQCLINDRHLSKHTVIQGSYQLVEFWAYLSEMGLQASQTTDRVLSSFRDSSYRKVIVAKSHRNSPEDAKRTINLKLSRIYDWLVWMQGSGRLPTGVVDACGLVTVYRPADDWMFRGRNRRRRESVGIYPLLFKVRDINKKHAVQRVVVLDEHVSQLLGHFVTKYDLFTSQRNCLFVELADMTGFRRASICSLTVDQFDRSAIDGADGEFLVRPLRQKFSYSKTFAISLLAAYRVRQFIDDYWIPWVEEHGISASVHQNHIFLSSKSGSPITERAMSQIVSKGFRDIGFEKGVGPHALRGKFASQVADEELEIRQELGLDTSNRSIAASMAMKLGHNDPDQFYKYASSSQARRARIERDQRKSELGRLRSRIIELEQRLEENGLHEDLD